MLTLWLAAAALGQDADTSNDGALHGAYFIREILITGQNPDGTIASAISTIGVATFDGAGSYTFAGSGGRESSGVYGLGVNGLLFIQSFVDPTQYAYGGVAAVGPSAFVASATEGNTGDILVAIPAGTSATSASLTGDYTAGYISFPTADITKVRQATFNFTADGAGNLSNVAGSGNALNLGGTGGPLTISGASYTLSGKGSGSITLGSTSATKVLSGSLNFYLSADGNLFIAGTPGGYDLIVGARSFTGAANNASWNNVYFTASLEDGVLAGTHSLDTSYGSWNANGQGLLIAHQRYQALAAPQQVFDYTFDSQYSVRTNGAAEASDIPYQFTLAAGGQVFIASGTQGIYSLFVGFAAPQHSGSGVFLNPLGVVNAANFAPITNPIAPGEMITLFGSGLSSGIMSASGLPLSTNLNGVQVMINREAAPLFYVSPGQITALVPQDISPNNDANVATIQVINNGTPSNATTVYTNYTAPGVFTTGSNGTGPAAALLNNAPITASNPLSAGTTVVLFATGLGTVKPVIADGNAAPANPPATTVDPDAIFVGGYQQNVAFNGLTPGLASLYQVNATIVHSTPTGTDFTDVATPDAYTSEATLAVGGSASVRVRPQVRMKPKASGSRPGRAARAVVAPKERN